MTQTLRELVASFDDLQARVCSYDLALSVMDYDSLTQAPPSGAEDAARSQATLFAARHELEASDETGELLDELAQHRAELDGLHQSELDHFMRTYNEEHCLPAELVGDYRRVVAEAFPVWRAAKDENDFARFAPYLERIFALLKEEAACIDPAADPYDVLLDRRQHGNSTEVCDAFFTRVAADVAPLVHAIGELGEPTGLGFTHAEVSPATQQLIAYDLAKLLGLDMQRLTFGYTEHPFSTEFGRDDVRIAHHYLTDDVLDGVSTTCHECGHALYMQNVDPIYSFTCLHGGIDAGIHESQSRLMENNVGRSRAFMDPLLEILRTHVPEVYGDVSAEQLYRACNVVHPGFIRTQADELTYPLHILVRYECEKELINGEITVADIPELWHDLMMIHLGVEVPNDTLGCLQDMHWATDFIGYFTSYALGNAYAAQFMYHLRASYAGDLDAAIAAGDLAPVDTWLREHIWRYGRSMDTEELIEHACGEPFDPSYYIDYLVGKYSALYGIEL